MKPYMILKRIVRKSSSFVKTKKRIKKMAATMKSPSPSAKLVSGVNPTETIRNPTAKLLVRITDAAIVSANKIEIYQPENDLISTPITPANERMPTARTKPAKIIAPGIGVINAVSTMR